MKKTLVLCICLMIFLPIKVFSISVSNMYISNILKQSSIKYPTTYALLDINFLSNEKLKIDLPKTRLFIHDNVEISFLTKDSNLEYNPLNYNEFSMNNITDMYNVEGYIYISIKSDKKTKLIIETPTNKTKWINLNAINDAYSNRIWLHWGTGKYEITVIENTFSNMYKMKKKIYLNNIKDVSSFVYPSSFVESDSKLVNDLMGEILIGSSDNLEKAEKIYEWLVKNISYDYDKNYQNLLGKVNLNFGAIETLEKYKGICYDFATTYAALGRAAGLKVKVVIGNLEYNNQIYKHAWNEVYIDSLDKWINVDSSTAVTSKTNKFDDNSEEFKYIKFDEE